MTKSTYKISCTICWRTFKSTGWRDAHIRRKHNQPRPLPPPSKTTTETGGVDLPETLILKGGADLHPGDIFEQHRRFVVLKITKQEGMDEVEVEAECVKRTWNRYRPTI